MQMLRRSRLKVQWNDPATRRENGDLVPTEHQQPVAKVRRSDEQRSQAGCSGVRMSANFCHGLLETERATVAPAVGGALEGP